MQYNKYMYKVVCIFLGFLMLQTASFQSQAQKKTGEQDALVVMDGTLENFPIVVAAFNFMFLGGSMGSVVGEKFVRGVNLAMEK